MRRTIFLIASFFVLVLLGVGCRKEAVPEAPAPAAAPAGETSAGDPLIDGLDAAIEDLKIVE